MFYFFCFSIILHKYNIESKQTELVIYDDSNMKIVKNYIASLRLEGKSEKTIDQYYRIVCNFLKAIGKPIKKILTGDIRYYLARAYEAKGNKVKAVENYKKIVGDAKFKAFAEQKIKALGA